jgi:hypothetical protein
MKWINKDVLMLNVSILPFLIMNFSYAYSNLQQI